MKTKIFVWAILVIFVLTSCAGGQTEPTATPVDIPAIQTSVVATVFAGATQTVEAYTPTSAPEPTEEAPTVTPTPGITDTPTPSGTATEIICDNLEFVSDVTVPDGALMTAGQEFIKTWKVKNIGACTWTSGYNIINAEYGEKMSGQTTALTVDILPNTEGEISITLKAPNTPGTYSGYWRLANNNGYPFGTILTVVVIVE